MSSEGNQSHWGLCGTRHAAARPCRNVLDFGQLVVRCGPDGCLLDLLASDEFEPTFTQPPAAEHIPPQSSRRPRR